MYICIMSIYIDIDIDFLIVQSYPVVSAWMNDKYPKIHIHISKHDICLYIYMICIMCICRYYIYIYLYILVLLTRVCVCMFLSESASCRCQGGGERAANLHCPSVLLQSDALFLVTCPFRLCVAIFLLHAWKMRHIMLLKLLQLHTTMHKPWRKEIPGGQHSCSWDWPIPRNLTRRLFS